jgi:hypothetical protein
MKNGLYLFAALLVFTGYTSRAQSFSLGADTIYYSTDGYYSLLNNVTNYMPAGIILQWHQVGNNFPASLQSSTCLCDNTGCNHDSTFFVGGRYESYYPSGHGEMHLMGDVTGLSGGGPYYISLRFNNKALPTDVDTTTFVITWMPALGLSVPSCAHVATIFPNPAKEMATISVSMEKSEQGAIIVADMTGKNVYSASQFFNAGDNSVTLPLQSIAPGMYNVLISAGKHIISRKLTVAR